MYKIKDLDGEKIIETFYEKELFRSELSMNYYPEQDSHIIVVLDLSNYAIKKRIRTCYKH